MVLHRLQSGRWESHSCRGEPGVDYEHAPNVYIILLEQRLHHGWCGIQWVSLSLRVGCMYLCSRCFPQAKNVGAQARIISSQAPCNRRRTQVRVGSHPMTEIILIWWSNFRLRFGLHRRLHSNLRRGKPHSGLFEFWEHSAPNRNRAARSCLAQRVRNLLPI